MKHQPLLVTDKTAAAMLDMRAPEFCALVAAGSLPQPIIIAGLRRWRMAELTAIADGTAPKITSDLEL